MSSTKQELMSTPVHIAALLVPADMMTSANSLKSLSLQGVKAVDPATKGFIMQQACIQCSSLCYACLLVMALSQCVSADNVPHQGS